MISINLLKKTGLQTQGIEGRRTEKPKESRAATEEKKMVDQRKFEAVKKEVETKISGEKPPRVHKKKRRRIGIYFFLVFTFIIIGLFIGYRYISNRSSHKKSHLVVERVSNVGRPQVVRQIPKPPARRSSVGIDNFLKVPLSPKYYPVLYSGYELINCIVGIIEKINLHINIGYIKTDDLSLSFSGMLRNNSSKSLIEDVLKSDRLITDTGTLLFLEDNGGTKVISINSVDYVLDKRPTQFYYCNIDQISRLIGYCSTKSNISIPVIKIGSSDENGYNATLLGKADLSRLKNFINTLGSYPINIKYNSIFIINTGSNNYEFSIELKILKVRSNA